jgi:hypothetical protein
MPSQNAPIPIPLASFPALSSQASDERLINVYAEKVGDGQDARAALYGAAGLTIFNNSLDFAVRGLFAVNNALLAVAGQVLFSITSAGVQTSIGAIAGTSTVRFARNGNTTIQTLLLTSTTMYTYIGGVLATFSDPDLPANPVDIEYLDGRFVWPIADGRVFYSGLNDITVGALDFVSAEGNPDGLIGCRVLKQELFLFGTETIEVFASTGDANAPIQRLPGAVVPSGCSSRDSITLSPNGDSLYFLDGSGNFMRIGAGYQPQKVSHRGVWDSVRTVSDKTTIRAFSYTLGEHAYVVLWHSTFCWVFDEATNLWHERSSNNQTTLQYNCLEYAFGKNLVGSATIGAVYQIDENAFDEAGNEILSVMRFPRVDTFPDGAIFHAIEFDIETGVGIDQGGQPADTVSPNLTLRWSDDGGKTYKGGRIAALGEKGKYKKRVKFTRLGCCGVKGRIFQVEVSSRVFKALINAQAIVERVPITGV